MNEMRAIKFVNILRGVFIILALLALYIGIADGQVKSVFIKAIYI